MNGGEGGGEALTPALHSFGGVLPARGSAVTGTEVADLVPDRRFLPPLPSRMKPARLPGGPRLSGALPG